MKKIMTITAILLLCCLFKTNAQKKEVVKKGIIKPNSFELSINTNTAAPKGEGINNSLLFNPGIKLGYRISKNFKIEIDGNFFSADPSFNAEEYSKPFVSENFASINKNQDKLTKGNTSIGAVLSIRNKNENSSWNKNQFDFSLHGGISFNKFPNFNITHNVNGVTSSIASYGTPPGYNTTNLFIKPAITYTRWLTPNFGFNINVQYQQDLGNKEFEYNYKDLSQIDYKLPNSEIQFQIDNAPVVVASTKGITGSLNFGVGLVLGFGKTAKKNLVTETVLDNKPVRPSKTILESLPLPSSVPNGGGTQYCVLVSHKTLISNTPPQGAIYSNCAMWSGYLCYTYIYPCGGVDGSLSEQRIKGNLLIPDTKGFSGAGYIPVVLKLQGKSPKQSTGGELIIDSWFPVEGDLSPSGILKAYYLPGKYRYNKNNEVTLQIYFVTDNDLGSGQPLDNQNNPTSGWCTVKRYRNENCVGGGLKWCGEYTNIRCSGSPIDLANSVAFSPDRVMNQGKPKEDSINLFHFAFKSLAEVESFGKAIAKSWGKAFEIEKHKGRNYMKFRPVTLEDKEILIFPVYNPTPDYHLVGNGYTCIATNCNCVGDCYCVTSASNPQYGSCVKGSKISIGFGSDWIYYYQ